jgi:hypothetical protein
VTTRILNRVSLDRPLRRHKNSWQIDICSRKTLSFASWGATAGNRVVLFTFDLGIQSEGMDYGCRATRDLAAETPEAIPRPVVQLPL